MTVSSSAVLGPVEVLAGLRVWGAGYSADEAAVELLAALAEELPALLDLFPTAADPWLLPCPRPGVWFIDARALMLAADRFPARVRPVIFAVAGLVDDGAQVEIGVTLAGVPVDWLWPVFAALVRAVGSPCPLLVVRESPQPVLDGLGVAA